MADGISANYSSLPPADLRAGYVTGTPDIQWTPAQLATAQVTIDQGANGSPVLTANVRDVEPGAWSAQAAVDLANWDTPRPTIYCNQSTLPDVLQAGWQGDLWLAIVAWQPGDALPSAPGCTIVAVQNQLDVNNLYDLSVVLDPTWPEEAVMPVLTVDQQSGWAYCFKCSGLFYTGSGGNVCPAGGSHDSSKSGPYQLTQSAQIQ